MQIEISVDAPQVFTFDNYADAQAKLNELAGSSTSSSTAATPAGPPVPTAGSSTSSDQSSSSSSWPAGDAAPSST